MRPPPGPRLRPPAALRPEGDDRPDLPSVSGERVIRERCLQPGPYLERHAAFPERTNVQLFEALDRGHIRLEIWERGAGYTLASGTSASAVAAACMRAGLVDDHVTVQMPGGDLAVRRASGRHLFQAGPARRVYRATIDLAYFRRDQEQRRL